jgi:mannose/cellobiose epimerase-like protein (N-acyl-D-glucosamine 2-epimerase family)
VTPPGAGGPLGELLLRLWEAYAFLHRVRVSAGAAAVGPSPASGLYDGEYFRRQLVEEILPFWEEHAVDRRHGGFLVHLDRRGRVYDASRKFAAMQGRMVYAFSIGHRLQPGAGYLDRAEQGVQFLFDHFWDDRFGGWYRVVHRDGRPDVTAKHMFDHSYVLIGLSEYYRETRDPEVLGYIERTCQRLADHLWDREHLVINDNYFCRSNDN